MIALGPSVSFSQSPQSFSSGQREKEIDSSVFSISPSLFFPFRSDSLPPHTTSVVVDRLDVYFAILFRSSSSASCTGREEGRKEWLKLTKQTTKDGKSGRGFLLCESLTSKHFFFFIIPGRLFLRGQTNSACVHIDSCPIFLFIFLFYLIRKNRQTFDFFFFPIVTKDSGRWIDSFLKGEGE
jgi:hypothetical protein